MTKNLCVADDITLEDSRVKMRPLNETDIEYLLPFALHEPELWKFSLITGAGEGGLKNYISIALKAKKDGTELPFIIFDKLINEYAGSTRYYDINYDFSTLQIGYTWYGKKFQGTGVNKHCKYLLLEHAFEKLNMERAEFRANAQNARSIAAMKSIGCKVDGILRNNMPKHTGGRRNSIVLSILKDEWFGDVKEMLGKKLSMYDEFK